MEYNRLKEFRYNNNLIQDQEAAYYGVTQETYSRWEQDIRNIPLVQLLKISERHKESLDYLLNLTDINNYNNINNTLNREILSSRFKEIRKELHYTQDRMAKKLNTTQSTISAYESGKTVVLTIFLVELSIKHGYSVDWIAGKSSIKKISN